MAEPVTIRLATPADRTPLGHMGAALMRQHHAEDPRRFLMTEHPEEGYGRFLVSELRDENVTVRVAESEGEVVGYVFAGLEPLSWKDLRGPCGYVHDVYVEEKARRQGVARRLMEAALEWARARGRNQIVLTTMTRNLSAQRLFASLGFRPTMVEMTRDLD